MIEELTPVVGFAAHLTDEEKRAADERIENWIRDVRKQQEIQPVYVRAEYHDAMDALRELSLFHLDGAQLSSIHDDDKMRRHASEGGFQPRRIGASGAGVVADRIAVTGKILRESVESVERYGMTVRQLRAAVFCRFLYKKKISALADRLGVTPRQMGRATREAFTRFEDQLHDRGFMGVYESENFEFDLVGWGAISRYLDKSERWCHDKRKKGMPVYGSKSAGIYASKNELAAWLQEYIRKSS